MKTLVLTLCYTYSLIYCASAEIERNKRSLLWPGPDSRSLIGIFLAIAVPVELPDIDVFVSYNFESNYYLPYNRSELNGMGIFSPITDIAMGRNIDRKSAYNMIEDQFTRLGFPGRPCLLRSICEASEVSLFGNGVVGDIAHIIFTPSSSVNEDISTSFYLAEKRGTEGKCDVYKKKCPSGVLDKISKIFQTL